MALNAPPIETPGLREELVSRADALRSLIRDQAAEAETLGHYTEAVNSAFIEAGFYQLLAPSMFGGLEVDLRTFAEVIVAVGRADPGAAWCLSLGQGHALTVAAHWPEPVQRAVFNNPRGYFRASHAFAPSGTYLREEGNLRVNARSRYQSGSAFATHVIVSVVPADAGPPDPSGPPPAPPLQVLIPEGQFTVIDDWGGDAVLGLRASGSNTVQVDDQVVPEEYGLLMSPATREATTSPGVRLHGNPLYLGGTTGGFFELEVVGSVVGAAYAALDEYDHYARTKPTSVPGGLPRIKDPMYQRDFGEAQMRADSAMAILRHAADQMTELNIGAVQDGVEISQETDMRLVCTLMQAGRLAADAVELLFASAGTSVARRGEPLQRYMRDVSMYRTHIGANYHMFARRLGATHFGEELTPFA